jgi:uncharacterized protein YfaS (alpha-2-macroglobulin family)
VVLTLTGADAKRGAPLAVRGEVTADGERCAHVMVDIVLRDARGKSIFVGSVATDERGNYDGSLVLPSSMPLGDYDVAAVTGGDAKCGPGGSQ